MRNLFGTYEFKLDAKGRLSLPSSFKKALPDELVVTLSPSKDCLYVFDNEGFAAWVEALFARDGGFDEGNADHVRARRLLNSRAKMVEVDGSGRIGISPALRDEAKLEREVAVIGNANHFEVWDTKRWRAFAEDVVKFDSTGIFA